MIKVIHTNLSIDNEGVIRDHQSLTYDVESWEGFIEGVKAGELKVINSTMYVSENKSEKPILNIEYDEYHMTVDYENQKSLFYAISQRQQPKYYYE